MILFKKKKQAQILVELRKFIYELDNDIRRCKLSVVISAMRSYESPSNVCVMCLEQIIIC